MISRSYILRPTEDRERLLGTIDEACIAINDRLPNVVFDYTTAEDKGHVHYYFWHEQMNNAGWIRLVEDFEMPAQYIEVSVPTTEMSEVIFSVLKERLPLLSTDELKMEARKAIDDASQAGALARLGVGAQGSYDPEVQEILEQRLQSHNVDVRTAATLAIFLLKWPEFSPSLQKAIVKETDLDLRAKMAYALSFCVAASSN